MKHTSGRYFQASADDGSSTKILDNVISNNVMLSAFGGGISLFEAGKPLIQNKIILLVRMKSRSLPLALKAGAFRS
jgi:hypothetical protein